MKGLRFKIKNKKFMQSDFKVVLYKNKFKLVILNLTKSNNTRIKYLINRKEGGI